MGPSQRLALRACTPQIAPSEPPPPPTDTPPPKGTSGQRFGGGGGRVVGVQNRGFATPVDQHKPRYIKDHAFKPMDTMHNTRTHLHAQSTCT